MNVMVALPADHPMRQQWNEYELTFEFSNTRKWALSENTVDGSLWGAFSEGWQRAMVFNAEAAAQKVLAPGSEGAGPGLPEVIYDTMRVQRHMKDRGYNVDPGTVSKILDAVVQIYDADKKAKADG